MRYNIIRRKKDIISILHAPNNYFELMSIHTCIYTHTLIQTYIHPYMHANIQAKRISKSIPESINFSYRGSVVTATTVDGSIVEYNDSNLVKNNEDLVDSNYNGNIILLYVLYIYIYMMRMYVMNRNRSWIITQKTSQRACDCA